MKTITRIQIIVAVAAYGNEVPVATSTCDGAMSATDKALLDDLKKRVEALESKL